MAMTVVVTRDVPERFRGFLASVLLEVAPGIYTSPNLPKGIRERVWSVLDDWHGHLQQGSIVMTWRDVQQPGGQGLSILGAPARTLVEHDGLWLSKVADADPRADIPQIPPAGPATAPAAPRR